MKKIIAISVMFALIAGAAFADLSVGGNAAISGNLAESAKPDAKAGGMGFNEAHVNFQWSGDDAGGLIRLKAYQNGIFTVPATAIGGGAGDPDVDLSSAVPYTGGDHPVFAFVWWKPIDQLRVQFGQNPDGDWGHAQIVGWGFTAEAKPAGVAIGYSGGSVGYPYPTVADANVGFWGGFNSMGAAISVYPADGIEIDLGVPLGMSDVASVVYSNSAINVKADIPNIGTARVALDLHKADKDADLLTDFFLAFYLSAIENMGVELGIGVTSSASGGGTGKNDVIDLGVGYKLDAGDLGLKAALAVGLKNGDAKTIPVGLALLPSYNLGSLTAFVNIGFATVLNQPSGADSVVDFFFNPYVKVPTSAGNFYAGIKYKQDGKTSGATPDAQWSIPIGWQAYF